ncbi:ANTAR domain-containing response regulator [Allopusillimonas ginsengisoli]|uniref:ANTAR domain-containing response regulator n=1 Tax=Allopusillimonas ginsengisoli TaxID=453575 RepID=UPI0010C1F9CC|nr:ANTAR domain-containing protein [Allopusillimonas ginsengisoli]
MTRPDIPGHKRSDSEFLRDLRTLRVAAFHPPDDDGEELLLQLRRIGCQAQAFWPPRPTLPEGTDVVFVAVRPDVVIPDWRVDAEIGGPTVIAIVTYENPTVINAVLRMGVEGLIASPIRPFGLLSSLVIARQLNHNRRQLSRKVRRLEVKLSGIRYVVEAKEILMRTRRISEEEAYEIIRGQAMNKRTTIEQVSGAIVNANEVLFR